MIVNVIDVMMKSVARTQVILPIAVAAERPDTAPPPPPPPIPRPPPSDRCSNTTAIRPRARIRWMIRTTFSIGTYGSSLFTLGVSRQVCPWGQGRIGAAMLVRNPLREIWSLSRLCHRAVSTPVSVRFQRHPHRPDPKRHDERCSSSGRFQGQSLRQESRSTC